MSDDDFPFGGFDEFDAGEEWKLGDDSMSDEKPDLPDTPLNFRELDDGSANGMPIEGDPSDPWLGSTNECIIAHHEAFAWVPLEDRLCGHLDFEAYLSRYVDRMGLKSRSPGREERLFYMGTWRLGEDKPMMEALRHVYLMRSVRFPEGIEELPVWWGRPLHRMMVSRHWGYSNVLTWDSVFAWRKVALTGRGYLNLFYPTGFPFEKVPWHEMCRTLTFLHMHLDPGPFSAKERFREFVIQ